jgi:sigma-B regulation protein RsbU (phosphoserine phosphatase)
MDSADRALPSAQALFEDAPCGILLTTPDGTIRRVNRTFCRWIGTDANELIDKRRLQDLFTMGGRIFHQTHWVPLLQMQGSVAEVKLDIVHPAGHTVPIILNAVVSQHAGTSFHEVSMFVAEDRSKYERELLRARSRAEELLVEQQKVQRALTEAQAELDRQRASAEDRALFAEQMMAIVSHDLRNPLSAIQMSNELLLRADLGARHQRVLERIDRSTKRAQRLIENLLDFTVARVGQGLSITLDLIELHHIASAVVDELAPAFPGRELVHRSVGSGACRGDVDRLTQAIGNLVSNAMAYGAFDRPVCVTSRIDSDTFSLDVHNEGKAIASETLPSLFEPMVRGSHTASMGGSVGLGLFIVREIARAHGGEIHVSSSDSDGTTFSLRCPR